MCKESNFKTSSPFKPSKETAEFSFRKKEEDGIMCKLLTGNCSKKGHNFLNLWIQPEGTFLGGNLPGQDQIAAKNGNNYEVIYVLAQEDLSQLWFPYHFAIILLMIKWKH